MQILDWIELFLGSFLFIEAETHRLELKMIPRFQRIEMACKIEGVVKSLLDLGSMLPTRNLFLFREQYTERIDSFVSRFRIIQLPFSQLG
ncbi:unnamed protein product [Periconia digitata]|uniref:Uncharacterized protein n=1 Tax=Periconia digitata TaxID=1303443 RepID=A0A9W4XP05_9PLEO|nr:unnamed protein product [Periconia digitata]